MSTCTASPPEVIRGCPFYSMAYSLEQGVLAEQTGPDKTSNRCGLIHEKHSPCQMQVAGNVPDWTSCSRNDQTNANYIASMIAGKVRAFPRELQPESEEWEGVPLEEWIAYCIGDKE